MNSLTTKWARGTRVTCCWLPRAVLIALLALLAGCATPPSAPAQNELPKRFDPPEGWAGIIFYTVEGPTAFGYFLTAGGNDLVVERIENDTGNFTVTAAYVLPQSYGFWSAVWEENAKTGELERMPASSLRIRTLSGEIVDRVELSSGETRIFRRQGESTETIEEIDHAMLMADPEVKGRDTRGWDRDRPVYEDGRLRAQFLDAEGVRFRSDDGCLMDSVTARWPNAEFVASTNDCRMDWGELMFDDGTQVRMQMLLPRLDDATFIPVSRDSSEFGLAVGKVLPGSPAERAGLTQNDRIVAVNGTAFPPGRRARRGDLIPMLQDILADAGESVTLELESSELQYDRQVKGHVFVPVRREVNIPLGEAGGNRLTLLPGGAQDLTYPDGRRFSGRVELLAPPQYEQALPTPSAGDGMGQLVKAGDGYLGGFRNGQPDGYGYCFNALGRGAPCRYDAGRRVHSDGAPRRSREAILSDTRGLSGSAAIDLLRQRMVDALYNESWRDYLARVVDLRALGVDTGLESIYYEAVALSELGQVEPAFDRVNAYINLAGNTGAAYAEALALYDALQPRAQAIREQRQREQPQAREERLAFCEARNRAGAPLCGCREFEHLDIEEAACRM